MDISRYRIVRIPKRSGGMRQLEIPDEQLMDQQRSILRWLSARKLAASPHAHGFVLGRSIATNAVPHVGKKVVIRIDLENFFSKIRDAQIRQALLSNGVRHKDVDAIIEICTLEGRLPQGSPASPFLSNLVTTRLDFRIAGLVRSWRGGALRTDYTRYADDLSISSDDARLNHIVPIVTKIVEDCGFKVNRKKLRIYRRGVRQIVAGTVVNDRVNAPRALRRNLRARLHQTRAAIMRGSDSAVDVQKLRGLASHIHALNPVAGSRFIRDVDEIERLLAVRQLAK